MFIILDKLCLKDDILKVEAIWDVSDIPLTHSSYL